VNQAQRQNITAALGIADHIHYQRDVKEGRRGGRTISRSAKPLLKAGKRGAWEQCVTHCEVSQQE
jgi:hypothetical protein